MRRWVAFVPFALVATGVLEIVVFVLLGHLIGFGWAVLALVAVSLLGLFLSRREGVRAWRRFRSAAESGQPPGEQVSDGLIGLGAGVLLSVPGFVSGAVGLLLLVPPVRSVARRAAQRSAERRISSAVAGDLFGPRRVRVRRGDPQPGPVPDAAAAGVPDDGEVVEGEIVEPGRR